VCGDGTPFIHDTQRWQGAQTLLRAISYLPGSQALTFLPVAETASLRQLPALLTDTLSLPLPAGSPADSVRSHMLLPPIDPTAIARPTSKSETGVSGGVANTSSSTGGRQVDINATFTLLGDDGATAAAAALAGQSDPLFPFAIILRIHTGVELGGCISRLRIDVALMRRSF
jgi:hypothetical protein